MTAKIRFIPNPNYKPKGEEAGFIIKGIDYAALKFVTTADGCRLRYVTCTNAMKGAEEKLIADTPISLVPMDKPYTQKYAVDDIPQPRSATPYIYVRVKVNSKGIGNNIKAYAQMSYSLDGKKFQTVGDTFTVKEGKWIGAKLGFYNSRPSVSNDGAFLDIDWIKFTK